jgi:phage baseplate assembly protein gpV
VRIEVHDGTKHPPQPPGVVVHPNGSELRQRNRAGMNLPDADCVTAGWILLVAKTEAVLVASFALSSRKADVTVTALGVSSEPSTKVDGSLLEHLGGDLRSPGEPGNQFGRGSVWSNHEYAASTLAGLPAVERVDQVKA